jgi:hypothetical protein
MESNNLICETRTYTEKIYTHNHSYSQLILPLQGSLSIKTDRNELSLDENHLFFVPPNSYHSFYSDSINKFLVLDIPREISRGLLGDTSQYEMQQTIDDRWKAIRYLLHEEAKKSNKRGLNDLVNYAFSFLLDEVSRFQCSIFMTIFIRKYQSINYQQLRILMNLIILNGSIKKLE